MRTLLAIGGPLDGQPVRVPEVSGGVYDPSWPGVYQRERITPKVEVLAYRIPAPPVDRWAPRRRTANFGVDRKPFMR